MPESPHIDADGFVFFQANEGSERRQLNARVGVGLNRTECHIEIGGIGRRHRKRIVCPNRESRLMLWEAWREMQRVNAQNRPITPAPKPGTGKRRSRRSESRALQANDPVECPQCEGAGGDCSLCLGTGEVTALVAVAWQGEHS